VRAHLMLMSWPRQSKSRNQSVRRTVRRHLRRHGATATHSGEGWQYAVRTPVPALARPDSCMLGWTDVRRSCAWGRCMRWAGCIGSSSQNARELLSANGPIVPRVPPLPQQRQHAHAEAALPSLRCAGGLLAALTTSLTLPHLPCRPTAFSCSANGSAADNTGW
jgi:hypothetical protein